MYHYALKAHIYTFSHCNWKFDLIDIYILNEYDIHMHIPNSMYMYLKKMQRLKMMLLKNLYSTIQV